MRCSTALHGHAQPVHRFADNAAQELMTVLEVLVGGGGTDARSARRLGHGETVRPVRLDQLPHRRDQLRPQVAVVIGGLVLHAGREMCRGSFFGH